MTDVALVEILPDIAVAAVEIIPPAPGSASVEAIDAPAIIGAIEMIAPGAGAGAIEVLAEVLPPVFVGPSSVDVLFGPPGPAGLQGPPGPVSPPLWSTFDW